LLKLIFKRKEDEVEDDDDNDEKKTQGFSLWKAIYLTLLSPKCWIHFQWSSSSSSSIRRSLAPHRVACHIFQLWIWRQHPLSTYSIKRTHNWCK
jgi:hypothetical protein